VLTPKQIFFPLEEGKRANPQKPKQVFSRKFISKAHIISIYSVKNDGKFETFLWYIIHKMSRSYYRKYFEIWMTSSDGKKNQPVLEMTCENCLAHHDHSETKKPIPVECTSPLLDCLLQMLNLSSSVVQKRILSIREIRITVSANSYTFDNIPELISKMCKYHIYWNISPEDANEIITRLGLSQYVFCVQRDPELGACLVVLQELGWSYSELTYEKKKEPRTIFRDAYREFNQSRTVDMTPAQRDTILSDEMKSSVEFTSVLPDGQIEVVFRREAIRTVVPEIKKQVEIDNLRRRLEELTSSSK
jgi:hypothetical protein